jgi:asparagine synthase (glutamine-hydrolysing)
MCGLVGIAATQRIENKSWLSSGASTLAHRGPDGLGEWWSPDGRIGLAHRRLAIIDLSVNAHQPMQDKSRSYSVVFNGEIYNHSELRHELETCGHQFYTKSDTEVLLIAYRHWGEDCVEHLNGMFAFAIHDGPRKRLFIARDRAGEKPLFYCLNEGELRFASELKALLVDSSMPREISPTALDCYLATGFVPGDQCILRDYKKLPPAHSLSFDLISGKLTRRKTWSLPMWQESDSGIELGQEKLLSELEELLEASVARQLAADVPVGILLSGGLDSSLITAMAVRHSDKVKTFTIGFPGHGEMDETGHARLIARHFNTDHMELMAEPGTADLIPLLAKQFDEPIADSSMIPTYLVSRLVRDHCSVALGGDGGDELFGGYDHYSRYLWMQKKLSFVPSWVRGLIGRASQTILPVGVRGRTYLQDLGTKFDYELPEHVQGFFDTNSRLLLLRNVGLTPQKNTSRQVFEQRVPREPDLIQRSTRMDFANYLADDLLVKVDRASMLNSLEMRSPMLDRELIEFAFGRVPSKAKVLDGNKKILLKKLAAQVLPPEFDQSRKQGFSIPLGNWLSGGPFRDLFYDVLLSKDCLFDRSTVSSLLQSQDKGRYNGERLFALVLFELWRKQYNIRV